MAKNKLNLKNPIVLIALVIGFMLVIQRGGIEPQIVIGQCGVNTPRCTSNRPLLDNDLIFCESEHGLSCSVNPSGDEWCLVCGTGGQCVTYPDGGSLDPPASEGSLYCNPSDDTWYECSSGGWSFESNCDGECIFGICESSPNNCVDTDGGEVTNVQGQIKIDGLVVRTDSCSDSTHVNEYQCDSQEPFYVVSNLLCDGICSDGACSGQATCVHPDNGATIIEGFKFCRWNHPQTEYAYECMPNGQWQTEACSALCDDDTGECFTGECVPGQFRNEVCLDSSTFQFDECESDRLWNNFKQRDCSAENKICQNDACVVSGCTDTTWTPSTSTIC